MATPINLVSLNVTYTNSVAFISWNMNATVNAIGGPTITLQTLNITAQNVNDLSKTFYSFNVTNVTGSVTSVSGGIRTVTNRYDNYTLYSNSTNLMNLSLGQTYNFSAMAAGSSQASGFPVPAPVNLTSAIIYATGSPLQIGSLPPVCFLKGTKILCADGEYRAIETLEKGMMIKTHLHGDIELEMLACIDIHHSKSTEDKRDQLFVYKKEKNPCLTEDLVLTGGHSALVDCLKEVQVKQLIPMMGQIYMTDDKFRLLACLDERADVYDKDESDEVIYHLCLKHENPEMNYGVWANGMLMETCQKVCMEKYL